MEINEYLIKIIQTVKDMESLELFPQASKLTQTEFRLIREIVMEKEQGKNIISSELARRLGITRSAVSQLVTKLEERDIVKRTASPTDRKIAYVCLSDSALAIFGKQCAQANDFVERVVAKFGEERINFLIEEYDKLVEAVNETKKEMQNKKTEE
ncbi:MAG: MarR family winged helix-turn-helix transcriptional regulator [Candidatus Gallimonas sp.]